MSSLPIRVILVKQKQIILQLIEIEIDNGNLQVYEDISLHFSVVYISARF